MRAMTALFSNDIHQVYRVHLCHGSQGSLCETQARLPGFSLGNHHDLVASTDLPSTEYTSVPASPAYKGLDETLALAFCQEWEATKILAWRDGLRDLNLQGSEV